MLLQGLGWGAAIRRRTVLVGGRLLLAGTAVPGDGLEPAPLGEPEVARVSGDVLLAVRDVHGHRTVRVPAVDVGVTPHRTQDLHDHGARGFGERVHFGRRFGREPDPKLGHLALLSGLLRDVHAARVVPALDEVVPPLLDAEVPQPLRLPAGGHGARVAAAVAGGVRAVPAIEVAAGGLGLRRVLLLEPLVLLERAPPEGDTGCHEPLLPPLVDPDVEQDLGGVLGHVGHTGHRRFSHRTRSLVKRPTTSGRSCLTPIIALLV